MLGNSNPTLAGDRLKETAISPAAPLLTIAATVITDVIHVGLGLGACVWLHSRSPGAFYRTPRVQRGLGWWGGRHTRQSDLRSAVLGRRTRCQAVGIWALLLLLLMTFNLFEAVGYFLFSGIGDIGDWAAIVARWQPVWAWRVALIGQERLPISFCEYLCAHGRLALPAKNAQRSSTQPERTNRPCGPNRGQK